MPFLQIKKKTMYLSVSNQPKTIRPLFRESVGKWVHTIPTCSVEEPGGKVNVLRFFKQVDADSTSYLNDNQDPLWDKLDKFDKYNRNNERQDFPVRPLHLLPVFDYEENDVKIARFGNQFYEDMTKYYDQGGDVCSCDWICWTEGSGRKTEYKMSRQDASPFNYSGDIQLLMQKAQELMDRAQAELTPFKSDEDLIKFLYGQSDNKNQISSQPPQQNRQLPQYTQGGSVNTPLGGIPSSIPNYQPSAPQHQIPPQTHQSMPHQAQQPMPPHVQPQAQSMPPYTQPQMQQPTPPQAQQMPSYIPQVQSASPPAQRPMPPPMQQSQMQQRPMPPPMQQPPMQQPPMQQPPMQQPPMQSPQMQPPPQQMQPPPQQAPVINSDDPYNFVLDFGKHSGKSLGWILENDKPYLSYLRGNKKEFAPIIDSVLSMITEAPPAQTQNNPQSGGQSVDNGQRASILDTINQKMISIPDFQGPGIATNMMPFLISVIGTTDFSNAPTQDLIKLSSALDQKLAQQ